VINVARDAKQFNAGWVGMQSKPITLDSQGQSGIQKHTIDK